ncbi:MAG: hypothetical protein ACK4HW_08545 [Roseinatronobacter sp.]
MSKLLKISAIPADGFFRAGEFWPHAGRIIDADTLSTEVMDRLRAEKMLHLESAPAGAEAEGAALIADALKDRLKAAIAALPVDAFGANGAPKVQPLRAALPEDAPAITTALVAEVWADLNPPKE